MIAMTKKISLADWTYIGRYNPAAKWVQPFCSYSLTKTDYGFRRDCEVGWFAYLILFLPVHLLQLFVCLWNGGLRDFKIQGRHLGYDYIDEKWENCGCYPLAKEVWERA
jgi:hypothetical protein